MAKIETMQDRINKIRPAGPATRTTDTGMFPWGHLTPSRPYRASCRVLRARVNAHGNRSRARGTTRTAN